MKSKKLLLSSLLMIGGIATYLTMSSNSGGITGKSTTGCGGAGCHGAVSANTFDSLSTNIPATGYVAGTTYNMTLLIANQTAKPKAGFDLKVTEGTIGGNPAGTMAMGTELHHTSPLTATVFGTLAATSINFTWTAATSSATSVTFNIAGNAVDATGSESGDEWALNTYTFNKATAPAGVSDVERINATVYPNPTTDNITIKTSADIKTVKAISLTGSISNLSIEKISNDEIKLDTKSLATGAYLLLLNDGVKTSHTKFIKQ